MILVTGATGHLGGSIINHLLTKVSANQIVALVRDRSKAAALSAAGILVREGNYHDAQSLKAAFVGVTKAVLVSSNDFEDRLGQHKNVVNAAKEASKNISSILASVSRTSMSLRCVLLCSITFRPRTT